MAGPLAMAEVGLERSVWACEVWQNATTWRDPDAERGPLPTSTTHTTRESEGGTQESGACFRLGDSDGNGWIDEWEARSADLVACVLEVCCASGISCLGLAVANVRVGSAWVRSADADRDGVLGRGEWAGAVAVQCR